MTKKIDNYFNLSPVLKTDCHYNLVIGKRSNGKTFSYISFILQNRKKNASYKGALLRRYDVDIKPTYMRSLFIPHDREIENLFCGEWNFVKYYNHRFYLCYREEGKIIRQDETPILHCFALNLWEHTKGVDNGYFNSILFDEFITRDYYLPDEYVIFCNVLSTLLRDRDGTKIFMFANTVNKYSIYFKEMGIYDIDKIKQGDTKVYNYGYGNDNLKICVHYAPQTKNTTKVEKYFKHFTNPKLSMITSGEWEINNYPHAPCKINNSDVLKRFYIVFDNKTIAGDIVNNDYGLFIYFHPQTKEINIQKEIMYCFEPSPNVLHAQSLRMGVLKIHKIIYDLIQRNKLFYMDNEVGEIVRNWLISQKQISPIRK